MSRRGRIPGVGRPWLRLWLSNRSSVAAHVVTTQGLQAALDRLGLGSRHVVTPPPQAVSRWSGVGGIRASMAQRI